MRRDDEKGCGVEMSKEVECKWSNMSTCSFEEVNSRKPNNTDCLMCIAIRYKDIAEHYAGIIGSEGAGRHYGVFFEKFLEQFILRDKFLRLTKEMYPEIWKEAEGMKKSGKPVIIAPYGLPKDVEKALRDFLKRSETGRV